MKKYIQKKHKSFIPFVGIDGCGKTTQARLLIEALKRDGIASSYVWCRWKPFFLRHLIKQWKKSVTKDSTETNRGVRNMKNSKRKLLRNGVLRGLWLIFFFIDYGLQVFVKVRVSLLKKQVIISDRIFYDSIIDQAINLGEHKYCLLHSLDSFWMRLFFPKPDMIIFFDCREDIAHLRQNGSPNIEYLRERRILYRELANKYGWVIIDGALRVDVIATQVKEIVYKELGL